MTNPTRDEILAASYALPARAGLVEFDRALEHALSFGPVEMSEDENPAGFDAWVRVGFLAHAVCGDDIALLFALCERYSLDPNSFTGE